MTDLPPNLRNLQSDQKSSNRAFVLVSFRIKPTERDTTALQEPRTPGCDESFWISLTGAPETVYIFAGTTRHSHQASAEREAVPASSRSHLRRVLTFCTAKPTLDAFIEGCTTLVQPAHASNLYPSLIQW